MTDLDPRLTDEDAQKVLARALQLQAQSDRALTLAQIREIASELSIPESAVDQALAEYRTAGSAELSLRPDAASGPTSRSQARSARPLMISLSLVGGAFVLLTILYIVTRLFVTS